ncbi:isochorismatase family protein [Ancylostoma ceylanicum]|uniref:Isochorismatase domain-containing protein 1 n=1 Tax=Ancylostoma ceylanicum TaxID=53326 RepID=A0A0D6LD58_9BILA|nr:isochorismatase family protein [Ancylostoma ceylanicum]
MWNPKKEWLHGKTIKFFPEIVKTSKRMVDAAKILDIPIFVTEQYPKGLGHTVPDLGLADIKKYEKTRFSMCVPDLVPAINDSNNIILVGIEAHACVLQTTLDLLEKGKNVHVVVDAVSSRTLPDRLELDFGTSVVLSAILLPF